ncbi:hypothetical protein [Williamsia soli]|uniref:hypothetical protein n=1 Tax=Williamsia soli TaxID=364929 RepID=UPI001A9E188E|nr:hypothetical protein [Williamsia soli]
MTYQLVSVSMSVRGVDQPFTDGRGGIVVAVEGPVDQLLVHQDAVGVGPAFVESARTYASR